MIKTMGRMVPKMPRAKKVVAKQGDTTGVNNPIARLGKYAHPPKKK